MITYPDGTCFVYLRTACGPLVEYGPNDDAETVEAACTVEGWRIDWETPAVKLSNGRFRSPLVKVQP